ncbi:carbohydrate esterase family 1 protein [Zasmidium cellare ATCC 36951]|uniref:feruloyl esterase n=1 Tax=Zasmidium cellare ATCC 36951 TaxID=1080233 RepID=A0A6A6CYI4_ZASCE|nr:carbohydrate esterase family 1 protein [Zasmidium cellare ATCC 36951]KAF2172277.1 carbohydrate esterase family 1 protein [Zasmidium cellare ATCC 36951]
MNGVKGTYTDPMFGLTWQVNCGQDTLGAGSYNFGGTGGQGIAGCFKGCAKRPNCQGFYYAGVVSAGGTAGSGGCYYKTAPVTSFVTDAPYTYTNPATPAVTFSHYAGVALLNPGVTSYACPMYNNLQFNDRSGNVWSVTCGGHYAGLPTPNPVAVSDMAGCMAACNTATNPGSTCTAIEYALTTAEPTSTDPSTRGQCYMYSTAFTTTLSANPNYGYAMRVGGTATVSVTSSPPYYTNWATTVTPTGSTSSSTATTGQSNSLSTSASLPAATSTACLSQDPVPSPPASPASCPIGNNYTVTSACGNTYYIYCGYDTTASDMSSQPTVSSVAACIQQCDSNSRCQAATYANGICYWKSAYKSLSTTTTTSRVAIVRYIPPNPNYAVPPTAPGTNTSTGCGQALPAGLTPDGSSVYYSLIAPDGKNRTYKVHIPRFYNVNRASPLIFGFPGNGDTASGIESQTGFNDGTLNPYGIAVYVDGWNLGFQSNPDWATGSNYADDLGFMRTLIDTMSSSFCVDTGRIWVTGQSNGGGFTNYLACDPYMSSRISVFSASCGAFYTGARSGDPATVDPVNTPTQPQCSPSRNNLPFLEFHGTNDGVIPYTGGVRRGYLLPTIPRWVTAWAIRQGYSSSNVASTPSTGVTMYQYGGRGSLGIITQYTLANWVHDWPKVSSGAPVDASPLIMNFFYDQTNYNRVVADGPSLSSSSSSFIHFDKQHRSDHCFHFK